ncbi:hypothetical protein ACFQL1_11230 [Halomicroarcula sp. GCM10025709]|uniref:hypothetical protein n=1 Tax=Haloarcula TaxID=2237 RepID=UPI0024C2DEB7|nr:hypothetical protein [Halomicroarcula sp. YJ-61-S]
MSETESVPDAAEYEQTSIHPEETLEDWLHQNPELLLNEQILVISRQARLETGVADLIGLDCWGNVVIFEVKIGRSGSGSASEETILSQPQNYAQSLSHFGYDDLNELYQEYVERVNSGEWDVDGSNVVGGTLQSDFEAVFGETLDEDQFGSTERMVVIAEEITRRTEMNVRYLLDEGLDFQCVELQAFHSAEGHNRIVASSTIVDYPPGRVRPKDRPSPTYPVLTNDILERAFPRFQSVTNAASVSDLFPDGIDDREPELVSQNENHPTSITYRLAPKPDDGTVVIAIDVQGETGISELQGMQTEFEAHGLEITGNQTYRVVTRKWNIDDAESLDDALLDDIADAYAAMVRMGHEAFTAA